MRRHRGRTWFGCLAAVVLLAALIGSGSIAARQSSFRWLDVTVLRCESDPGPFVFADGNAPPDDCMPIDQLPLSIETVDGFPIQTCLTRGVEPCQAHLPVAFVETTVMLRVDPAAAPDGFVPRANPVIIQPGELHAGMIFLPIAELEPGPGTASLTIHSRVCPPDYAGSAWFTDCHDNPPDFTQTLNATGPSERSTLTDSEGNAAFTGLVPGTWRFEAGLPDVTIDAFVFCSRTESPGVEYPSVTTAAFPSLPGRPVTTLELAAGDDILCDLYAIPASLMPPVAYLTVHARVCPEVLPDDEYYAACHDRGWGGGRIEVGVTGEGIVAVGYADQDGNRTFRVAPGSYYFGGPPGHWLADAYTFCSREGESAVALPLPLTLAAGDAVICDFYFVGTNYRGE